MIRVCNLSLLKQAIHAVTSLQKQLLKKSPLRLVGNIVIAAFHGTNHPGKTPRGMLLAKYRYNLHEVLYLYPKLISSANENKQPLKLTYMFSLMFRDCCRASKPRFGRFPNFLNFLLAKKGELWLHPA